MTFISPTILFVGERRGDECPQATTTAWQRIAAQYSSDGVELLTPLWECVMRADGHVQPAPKDIAALLADVLAIPPVPIPVLDDRTQPLEWFRSQLFRYLMAFNVWAIIATSTTALTRRLVEALQPLQVPILITLSSAGHLPHGELMHEPHVLSLYPSNDTQAQVIAAHVHSLRSNSGSLVHVLKEASNDLYVTDLSRALATHFKLQNIQARDAATAGAADGCRIIVCVGYNTVVKRFDEIVEGRSYEHVIFTDGVERHVSPNARFRGQCYQVVPVLPPALHAERAYCAVRTVLREQYLRVTIERTTVTDSFLTHVRRCLETEHDYYSFAGTINRTASYIVERLVRQSDR